MRCIENLKMNGQGRRLIGTFNFSSLLIRNSTFENCVFGYNRPLFGNRNDSITDSDFVNCKVSKCIIGNAILSKVNINNLAGEMLIFRGAMFDRVVLSGRISPLMLHGISSSGCTAAERAAKDAARVNFYNDVEFALDISEAEFSDFSIRTGAIPLALVRRDKRTQFLISNVDERITLGVVDRLEISSYTKMVLEIMLEENQHETLLVAPKLDRSLFDKVMLDAEVLKKMDWLHD